MARAGALLTPLALGASLAGSAGRPAAAQRPAPLTVEGRAEAVADRAAGAFAGVGVLADAGLYARVGVLATAGVVGPSRATAAAEVALVGRFLLDPQRQGARGVYAGGGLAVRAAGGGADPFVVLAVGVEGRARGGAAPAVELGLGHGVRFGVVVRRARPGRR